MAVVRGLRFYAALITAVIVPGLALSQAAPQRQTPLPVSVAGRVVELPEGGDRFGWPAIYFEARFKGPNVSLAVETHSDRFAVLIDGSQRALVTRPGMARLWFDHLGPGEHAIRLEKLTENNWGSARFLGFFPGAGTTPLAPPKRARQIEFIGDSYTVGYGDASPSRVCKRDEVRTLTDTQLAFGPVAAGRLGADYRVIAHSGYGLVRNYGGSTPGESMISIYPRQIPSEPTPVDDRASGWRPQLIVIGLGNNDFSMPVKPGEPWADAEALRIDYRQSYVRFVRQLLQRDPQAHVVLMAAANYAPDVEAVASTLNRDDPQRVRVLHYGGLELTGCDWHPSAGDHQALAASLLTTIEGIDGLWGPWKAASSGPTHRASAD